MQTCPYGLVLFTYGSNGSHPPMPARQRPLTQTGQCDYRARATVSDSKITAERLKKGKQRATAVRGEPEVQSCRGNCVAEREKTFRAGTGTGDSTSGFVSSAPSPNDAMPHYFHNHKAVSF